MYASGKVRDIYRVSEEQLLFIATDRISAFDYVLASGIPNKGRVLTQLSLFWFEFLKDIVPNHLLTANVDEYPEPLKKHRDEIKGRSMLVCRAQMLPIECVVRGYLSGSGWKDYQKTGCGLRHQIACRPEGIRQTAGTDLYAIQQSDDRARRKHIV